MERLWDGAEISVVFGSTGSWSEAEFLAALDGLPWRPLPEAFSSDDVPVDPAPTVILRIGRDRPSAGFLAGLDALHAAGDEPLVLSLGTWGWTLPYPRRLAGADTSPPRLRAFLERIR